MRLFTLAPPPAVLLALILGSAPMVALADCPTTPLNFDAADCVIDGNTVCTTSGTSFTCDVSWSDEDAGVTIVSDFDTSGTVPYEAWGEANGELFCCESSAQFTPSAVHIEGSSYKDILEFTWDSLTYNLNGVGASIAATIDGNDGDDTIRGSQASTNIAETLNGNAGDDSIRGHADAGVLNGGDGKDLMLGGAGNDECYGDGDADEMYGGPDDDVMDGGAGADVMGGDDGDDTMYGDAGADFMQGNAGDDEMYGEADRDRMAGGGGDDVMDGGTEGDTMCGDSEGGGDSLTDGDATDEGVGLRDLLYGANLLDALYLGSGSSSADPWSGCSGPGCPGLASLTVRPAACP